MFQRRHYELIADCLGHALSLHPAPWERDIIIEVGDLLVQTFQADNDHFKPARFTELVMEAENRHAIDI